MYARSFFAAVISAALIFSTSAQAQTAAQTAAGGLIAVCQNTTTPNTCTNTGTAQASGAGGIAIGDGSNSMGGNALAIGPGAACRLEWRILCLKPQKDKHGHRSESTVPERAPSAYSKRQRPDA